MFSKPMHLYKLNITTIKESCNSPFKHQSLSPNFSLIYTYILSFFLTFSFYKNVYISLKLSIFHNHPFSLSLSTILSLFIFFMYLIASLYVSFTQSLSLTLNLSHFLSLASLSFSKYDPSLSILSF